MISNVLTNMLLVVMAVAVLGVIRHLIVNRSPEAQYAHLMAEFNYERRGVPFAVRQQELTLRGAAASVRRRTSAAVLANPRAYGEAKRAIIADEVLMLASRDPETAGRFSAWAAQASPSELLYPAAMKAVVSTAPKRMKADITEDLIAALRVR